MVIPLPAEYILLLDGIAFAECLNDIGQNILESRIWLGMRTPLLHGILHFEDNRAFAGLGEKHRVKVFPLTVLHVLQLSEESVKLFSFLNHHHSFSMGKQIIVYDNTVISMFGMKSSPLLDINGDESNQHHGYHSDESCQFPYQNGK